MPNLFSRFARDESGGVNAIELGLIAAGISIAIIAIVMVLERPRSRYDLGAYIPSIAQTKRNITENPSAESAVGSGLSIEMRKDN